ncbi:MAG: hypothetical protein V9F00_03780 [Nocardioides sp.]
MKDRFSKPALIDGAFVFALGVVAAWGLRDSYTGLRFLIAAGVGLALGIVIGQVTTLLRSSAWMPVMVTIAAFFLLGGAVALNTQGVLAMLPLPGTLIELARQSIGGWKSLLTTLAPVDDGPLLALPYLLGLVCGAGGMVLARRTRYVAWPLVFPGAFLAAAILLGVFQPTRIALLGGAFSGLAFWWMHVRSKRVRRRNRVSASAWRQPVAALVMIGAAASAAVVLNGETPLLGNHDRVVLRSYVTPPFNVGQYPSPLITFRKYTKGYRAKQDDQYLWDQELFKVTGLREGARMRFAALDSYDGSTWRAADQAPGTAGASGSFQRVGSTIRSGARGRPVEAEVTIGAGYDGVWLPTTGSLTEIDFGGARGESQTDFFRYNLATSTGVVPSGLQPGDRYRFEAYVDDAVFTESMQPSADAVQAVDPGVDFLPVAQRWGGGAAEPSQQLMEIAHTLRDEGTYTDGEAGFESLPSWPLGQTALDLQRGRRADRGQRRAVRRDDGATGQSGWHPGPGGDRCDRPRRRGGPWPGREGMGGGQECLRTVGGIADRGVHEPGASAGSGRPHSTRTRLRRFGSAAGTGASANHGGGPHLGLAQPEDPSR